MCTHQTKNNTAKLLKTMLAIFGRYRTTKSRIPLEAKIIIITFTLFGIIHISSGDIAPKLNEDDDPGDELLLNKDVAAGIGGDAAGVVTTKNFIETEDLNSITNTLNTATTKNSLPINNLGFIHAFISSISVILVSELGDKTFFIAAIMAMRHARLTIFTGAMSALGLMTILSAVFGMAATIIPRVYTYYISTALFAIFGLKMLKEGYYMSPTDAQEELEEVQSDLRKREDELMKSIKDEDNYHHQYHHDDDDDDDCVHHRSRNDEEQTVAMLPSAISSASMIGTSGTLLNKDLRRSPSVTSILYHHHHNSSDNINNKNNNNNNNSNNNNNISINMNSIDHHHDDNNSGHHHHHHHGNNSSSIRTTLSNIFGKQFAGGGGGDGASSSSSSGDCKNIIISNNNSKTTPMTGDCKLPSNLNLLKNCNKSNSIEMNEIPGSPPTAKKRLEREVSTTLVPDSESGGVVRKNRRSAAYMASRVFMQAFTMTFLAEWGDRSQLTTIILSAREDVYGVIVGGILGHSLCTGLAVIGGRMIAQKISVRTVTLIGGVVFLVFAISALFFNPNEE